MDVVVLSSLVVVVFSSLDFVVSDVVVFSSLDFVVSDVVVFSSLDFVVLSSLDFVVSDVVILLLTGETVVVIEGVVVM